MSVIFSDDFNRADGDPGADYDADDGSLTIVSNRLRAVGDVVGEAFVRPLDLSTDWYCEFQLPTLTGGAEFGLLFRDQLGAPDNKYLINVKEDSVAFKAAFAGSYNTEFSDALTHSGSDVYALRCEGDTFDFIKNGSILYTFVDSTFATGYVLIFLNPNGDSTNIELDNLSFATLDVATAEQEGFRLYNDDGSESAATASQSQDTNDSVALGVARVVRALVNGTGDLASAAFTLRAQKNGSGGYVAVPVGATIPEVYGTVTFQSIGTGANGSTTVAPSYPASIAAGDYLVAVVTSGATNSETPTDSGSKWTQLATGASTDGSYGVDTGPRRVTVFGCIADGTESGTYTFNITNGGTCRGTISRFTKAGSGSWDIQAYGGNDSTSGTGFSVAFSSMNWNTGDATLVAVGQRVDTVTQSSQSLSATGVTFGTRTNRASTAVTTGNDHRHVVDTFAAVSSTSNVNAAPTWAFTGSASCSGGAVIVRLREYTAAITNELYVAPSSNITAGGEATTARLTAPSGKSTSDFVTGRIWDDENGTDSIDITTDDYTEVAWCLKTQAPATTSDYWDLRVYAGGSALDTYTVTPRLTIGGGTYDVSISEALTAAASFNAALDAAAAIAESLSAAAAKAAALTMQAAIAESGTAGAVKDSNMAVVSTVTEAATAAAAFDLAHTLLGLISEGATAAEAMAAILSAQAAVSEAGSAAAAQAATVDSLSVLVEAVTAAMAVDSTALTLVSAEVSESAAAAMAVTAILSALAAVAESGAAAAAFQGLWSGTGSVSESGSAGFTISATLQQQATLAETATAVFAAVSQVAQVSDVSESGSAGMALTTSLAALASLIESGAADAQLVAQIASIAFIAEAGAATVTYIDSDGNSTPEGSLLIIKAGSRFIQVRVESRRAPAKAASRRVVARTIH